TNSTDLPTTNAVQPIFGCFLDAFGMKLNTGGSALVYSTFLGGSENESGLGIAVDSFGAAYVTGFTESSDFPSANPLQATFAGVRDAFVAKISDAAPTPTPSRFCSVTNTNDSGAGSLREAIICANNHPNTPNN